MFSTRCMRTTGFIIFVVYLLGVILTLNNYGTIKNIWTNMIPFISNEDLSNSYSSIRNEKQEFPFLPGFRVNGQQYGQSPLRGFCEYYESLENLPFSIEFTVYHGEDDDSEENIKPLTTIKEPLKCNLQNDLFYIYGNANFLSVNKSFEELYIALNE